MKKIIALVLTVIMIAMSIPFVVSAGGTNTTGTGYAEGQTLITMSTLLTYNFANAVTYTADGVELSEVNFPAATLDSTDPDTANITAQQGHFILGAEDGISYRITNHGRITSNKQGKKIGTNTNLPLNENTKYTISFDVKPSDYMLAKGTPDYIGFVFTGADDSQMDGTGKDSRWKGYGWCASASVGNFRGVNGAENSKTIFDGSIDGVKLEKMFENYRNEDGYTTVSTEIDGYKIRVYVSGDLCLERTLSPVGEDEMPIDPYETGTLGLYLFSQWKAYGGTADEQLRMKNLVVKAGNVATKKDINLDGENELSLSVGKTQELMVSSYDGAITYSSNNSEVASVDENGKITAHKKGEAVITIVAGDKTTTCKVTVMLNTLPVETVIKEIEAFKSNVQGSDSPCGNQDGMPFVPNTALQTMNAAIAKARTDAENATLNDEITSIVDTLNAAFKAFKAEMKIASHAWNDGEITKQPTVDSKGEKTYTCTVCGATSVEPVKELTAADVAGDTANDTTGDTAADTTPTEGGCGSSVAFGGVALVTASLCGASLIGKKKKEDE